LASPTNVFYQTADLQIKIIPWVRKSSEIYDAEARLHLLRF